jgi:hypothetical protein
LDCRRNSKKNHRKVFITYRLLAVVLCIAYLGHSASLHAAPENPPLFRQEALKIGNGDTSAAVKSRLRGSQYVDYTFEAAAGQRLSVSFVPTNPSTYFNVLPPSSDAAIFIGSTAGNRFSDVLGGNGTYTIRVYLMRNAARRNETTAFSLNVSLPPVQPAATGTAGFDRTLSLQGITFRVSSTNEGSINKLRIQPSGLAIDNSPIVREIDGTVSGAEVADINVDGSPEIYIYVNSAGSGSYGALVAYSANRKKSLSEIYLPDLTADNKNSRGYMGHDEFAVVENVLARRFPIYRDTDTNAKSSGKMRQLQYKLVKGEASWQLRLDRAIEY